MPNDNSTLEYMMLVAIEGFSDRGRYGIQILIGVDHDITDAERFACLKARALIEEAVRESLVLNSPAELERAAEERRQLIALFPEPIFVEEIPNEYCKLGCCRHLPWFVVTTRVGRIKIGWRKRVINIDWTESIVKTDADALFPSEQTTRADRYIHAWGYEAAARCLRVILDAGVR